MKVVSQVNAETSKRYLRMYVPDTRGVTLEPRYGKGNLKIGLEVFTYSRLPGLPGRFALGLPNEQETATHTDRILHSGTCPGATTECQAICYARRPVVEQGLVHAMWQRNSLAEDVPPIPDEAKYLRLHVSGDFTSETYIENWTRRLTERPDVLMWAYTRSWRVTGLQLALEELRALPNVQLFASMDESTPELPLIGWRRAWIDGDSRAKHEGMQHTMDNWRTFDSTPSYTCPEETGRKPNCVSCNYCIKGTRGDVTFLRH